jgi:hypothetical protein
MQDDRVESSMRSGAAAVAQWQMPLQLLLHLGLELLLLLLLLPPPLLLLLLLLSGRAGRRVGGGGGGAQGGERPRPSDFLGLRGRGGEASIKTASCELPPSGSASSTLCAN